ncbi:YciI family protein [Nocardioides speluncae]|uniref:YciI family protein n=1 Tax=Nocardioides speluncae TaxID=2670337 RepID=UPI000D693B0E|nr:YciI family protein [Nocardioides speluncae]
MSQYLLSVYASTDGAVEGAPQTPEEMQSFMARVMALEEEMDAAGAFAFGGALHGPDAATVVSGGTGLDKVITDGPFVEAKEHIGGFYVISAEDLDGALAWAEKVVEATNHAIEVRPFRGTGRLKDQVGH